MFVGGGVRIVTVFSSFPIQISLGKGLENEELIEEDIHRNIPKRHVQHEVAHCPVEKINDSKKESSCSCNPLWVSNFELTLNVTCVR